MGINGIVERMAVRPDDLFYREHVARYELARKYVDRGRLLDIACGLGYGSEILQDTCEAMVVGVDIDQSAVVAAHQAYSNPQIIFMVGTGTALPFQPDSFLTITSMETIEHIEEDRSFLGELSRVLRPEGTCIISTPNQMHSLTHRVANPYHVREYSEDQLKNLLSSFFQSIQFFYQGFDESYYGTVQNYAETIQAKKKLIHPLLRLSIDKIYRPFKRLFPAPVVNHFIRRMLGLSFPQPDLTNITISEQPVQDCSNFVVVCRRPIK